MLWAPLTPGSRLAAAQGPSEFKAAKTRQGLPTPAAASPSLLESELGILGAGDGALCAVMAVCGCSLGVTQGPSFHVWPMGVQKRWPACALPPSVRCRKRCRTITQATGPIGL